VRTTRDQAGNASVTVRSSLAVEEERSVWSCELYRGRTASAMASRRGDETSCAADSIGRDQCAPPRGRRRDAPECVADRSDVPTGSGTVEDCVAADECVVASSGVMIAWTVASRQEDDPQTSHSARPAGPVATLPPLGSSRLPPPL